MPLRRRILRRLNGDCHRLHSLRRTLRCVNRDLRLTGRLTSPTTRVQILGGLTVICQTGKLAQRTTALCRTDLLVTGRQGSAAIRLRVLRGLNGACRALRRCTRTVSYCRGFLAVVTTAPSTIIDGYAAQHVLSRLATTDLTVRSCGQTVVRLRRRLDVTYTLNSAHGAATLVSRLDRYCITLGRVQSFRAARVLSRWPWATPCSTFNEAIEGSPS